MLNLNIYRKGHVSSFFCLTGLALNGWWKPLKRKKKMADEINFPSIIRRHARALPFGPHNINFFFWKVGPEDQWPWFEAHLYKKIFVQSWLLGACFLLLVSKCKVQKRKRINRKREFYNGDIPIYGIHQFASKNLPLSFLLLILNISLGLLSGNFEWSCIV